VVRELPADTAASQAELVKRKIFSSLVYVKVAEDRRMPLGVVTDLGVCTVMPGNFQDVELTTLDGKRSFPGRVATRSPFPFCWIDADGLDVPPAVRADEPAASQAQNAFIAMPADGTARLHAGKIENGGKVSVADELAIDPRKGIVAPGPVFSRDGTCLGYSLQPARDTRIDIYPLKRESARPSRSISSP
jgi:hypothetical protein